MSFVVYEVLKNFDAVPYFVTCMRAADLALFKVGLIHPESRPDVAEI